MADVNMRAISEVAALTVRAEAELRDIMSDLNADLEPYGVVASLDINIIVDAPKRPA